MTDHIKMPTPAIRKGYPRIMDSAPHDYYTDEQVVEIVAAALSAREGGEVDWRELARRLYVELFHCDQQMTSGAKKWTQGPTVRDVLAEAKAALTHPAQPASQQGEKDFEFGGYCGTCGSPCDDKGRSIHSSQQANPTGDRVRGLVEKWRAEVERGTGHLNDESDRAVLSCADELSAALDQEKGR